MKDSRLSRREFIRNTSILAGGTVAGAVGSEASANHCCASHQKVDTKKIVNYNEKMNYRRLGKTNLMLSEVSLGGHWKNRGGGRYWDTFADDKSPVDVTKNRGDIISACIDVGINYLDITTAAECLAYGAALKGRRDKMIVGADDHRLGPRNSANRNVKSLTFRAF